MKLLTPTDTTSECVGEEALAGDTGALTHTRIGVRVKCVEQGTLDKVGWPDWRRMLDSVPQRRSFPYS